jgi:hypothetical protein
MESKELHKCSSFFLCPTFMPKVVGNTYGIIFWSPILGKPVPYAVAHWRAIGYQALTRIFLVSAFSFE